ncbi:MAG: PAS domain-containing protein [Nitrospiraceae bacterium]
MSDDIESRYAAPLNRHLEETQRGHTIQKHLIGASESTPQQIHAQAAALSSMFTATAPVTGDEFFRSLVMELASVLKVRYALVGEAIPGCADRVRTRAFWANDALADNFEYDPAGTPCANVMNRETCYYERGVQGLFPHVRFLVDRGVDSYCGAPLFDRGGVVLGLLAVMHDRPMSMPLDAKGVLTIFAARAGAELERQRAEAEEERKVEQLAVHQNALIELAKHPAVHGGELPRAFQAITEVSTRTLLVGRASIWLYSADRSAIELQDLYESATGQHSTGQVLWTRDYPSYFRELEREERAISANDARTDPGTCELTQSYLIPMRIGAMLDAPIRVKGQVVGVLCHEHLGGSRAWTIEEQSLAGSFASMVTLAMEASERNRAEKALREAMERLDLAVRGSSDGLWDIRTLPDVPWHSPQTPVWRSPRFKEMLGYRDDEFPDVLESWASHLHPDDQQRIFGALAAHVERKVPYDVEYRLRTKQGEYRWFRARGQAIWDEVGRPIRISGSLTDVTERKRLEEQLIHSQRMQAVGQLAGGIAHDFNNLLTVINGYSDMLGDSSLPAETVMHAAREMKKAGNHAAALTHQLLAFSRKQILRPTTINVNVVVENLTRMLNRVIGENIQLNTVLSPDLWSVDADLAQFEQVIMNLAVNARDAMPRGGRLIIETVNMEAAEVGRSRHGQVFGTIQSMPYVRLAVTDTGTGMDETTQKRVFEPFFTTKEVGKGTGLGLAMVYGVVTQSGGFMEMTSVPKKGTTFMVYLPRSEKAAEPVERTVLTASSPEGSETILLVEDETIVRTFVRDLLKSKGYRVLEAADGEQALRVCAENQMPIDVLITDVVMPGMTGRTLADRVILRFPTVSVLFISGYAPDSLLLQGLPTGQAWFLYKPFPPDALLQKVREVLVKPATRRLERDTSQPHKP